MTAATQLPDLGCACATARRASRLVTRMYDHHLREFHLEVSQFVLLSALAQSPGTSQAVMVRALGLEKATLSRNLRLLEKHGWVEIKSRKITLTGSGRNLAQSAKAGWERAHHELQTLLGEEDWTIMRRGLRALEQAANQAVQSRHPDAP